MGTVKVVLKFVFVGSFLLHIVHISKENEVVIFYVFSLASLSPCIFPEICLLCHATTLLEVGTVKVVLKFVFVRSFLLHIVHNIKEYDVILFKIFSLASLSPCTFP